jgi:HSP20 family molecular chaperone IbpA
MTDKEKKELQVAEKQAIEKQEGEPTREGLTWVPQVDIIEDKEAITLWADLPGIKKDNVEIDVREGVLSLSATLDSTPENWQSVYSEYQIGGYSRRFTLGEQIDQSKISATMDNGVLTLVLAKAEAAKPRKIDIR